MFVSRQRGGPVSGPVLARRGYSILPTLAGTVPFSWSVYNCPFQPDMVDAARGSFPDPAWHGWHRYDSPGEKKLAANADLPAPCLRLLDAMNDLCPSHLRHDPKFHAAGLHAMPPGGWLDLHLDAERHPATGFRRAVNLILFMDPWDPSHGGALEFWDRQATRCEASVMPAAGRLVAFDCADAVHGIPTAISPFAPWRRSMAVFWYDPEGERRRAKFVAGPGESCDPAKEAWRMERTDFAK